MRLYFYKVNDDYCDFLSKCDDNVPYSSGRKSTRPFLGILLNFGEINYCAPLRSPKQKHKFMKNAEDFLKIDGGNLGVISLNNMIPVKKEYITLIDFKILPQSTHEEASYCNLLKNQLSWCNKNKEIILKKSNKLYTTIASDSCREELKVRCCDFKKLEALCMSYMDLINENEIEEELEL